MRFEVRERLKKNKELFLQLFFQDAAGALGFLGIPVRASKYAYTKCTTDQSCSLA